MNERTYAGHTLANLRALSDAATPPQPWVAQSGGVYNGTLGVNVVRDPDARAADLELIVVAVNALPALCDYIKDLEGEYAALEYLDSEATIGAELVNEELRQLRARVAVLEVALKAYADSGNWAGDFNEVWCAHERLSYPLAVTPRAGYLTARAALEVPND